MSESSSSLLFARASIGFISPFGETFSYNLSAMHLTDTLGLAVLMWIQLHFAFFRACPAEQEMIPAAGNGLPLSSAIKENQ
jgi:hypothetical protein